MVFTEISDYSNNLFCKITRQEIKNMDIPELANLHDQEIQKCKSVNFK